MRVHDRRLRGGHAALLVATVLCASPAFGQERIGRASRGQPRSAPSQSDREAALASSNGFRHAEDWGLAELSVLNIHPARVTIPGVGDGGSPLDFEVLTYNGRPSGPTIRVRRGSTFRIRVRNHLHGAPGRDKPDRPNGLCTTNLHTHGLHVSPADPSDNVYRCIEPGGAHTFVYRVPRDHPSGTYWYHPHKHGSVGYQVSNGLAGALIVEGSDEDDIADLEDIPEIAAARERIFLFQQYNYVIGTDGVARIDATAIYNSDGPPDYPRSCEEIDLHSPPGTATNIAITVNGVATPEVHMAPGQVERWRFIHAGIEREQVMFWSDAAGHELKNPDPDPTAPQFFEIARDGLATGDMKVQPTIGLYPGYRSDVLVRAPKLADGQKEAVYLVRVDQPADALKLRPRAADPPIKYLIKVVVRGRHRPMKLPDPAALRPCRPYRPIADGELSPPTISPDGTLTFKADDGKVRYTINGQEFHEIPPVRLQLRTAQEWTLKADGGGHPFHIHVNPFLVTRHLDASGRPVDDGVGDWKDTLFIPAGEAYTIRSRFQDFTGHAVLHCHILDHEDQGMMMRLEFRDGDRPLPPQDLCHAMGPATAAAGKLVPAAAPAPSLRLPEPGGTVRELAAPRGEVAVVVFIRGLGCAHCVGQLRDLVREARGTLGADATVVAVSGLAVADRDAAMRMLGVEAADRFRLLVDGEHRAFRAFGCYADAPMHGLFIIDGDGIIRARYSGPEPFSDAPEVMRRARSLVASRPLTRRAP